MIIYYTVVYILTPGIINLAFSLSKSAILRAYTKTEFRRTLDKETVFE